MVPCHGRKTALRTLVITFDTVHVSDKTLFQRFNFSVHNAANWTDAQLRNASAGRLL